ncbi:bifunctional phosphopantothenoylcysteine decarboxylase/phosphopantothenate--cysteine ligase CoaBC [Thermosulfuriphilus sp.]
MNTLKGKRILLGVTGGIAAYKAAEIIRGLRRESASVRVVMTEAAKAFISPLTFEVLTEEKVLSESDFFSGILDPIPHISLARWAQVIVVAPITAATISRLASGAAESLLVATIMASEAPVLLCPAMNTTMLKHPATQRNLAILKSFGYRILEPERGPLACGEQGAGRLPDWPIIREELLCLLTPQDLRGYRILVSAGPTRETIDPVRFISNRSSGKMGYALAMAARRRGANVTLVSGPVCLSPPYGIKTIKVETAEEMAGEILSRAPEADIIIMAAAVADYRPQNPSSSKIKKGPSQLEISLVKTPDILAELGRKKRENQIVIGFAAETENLIENARQKLVAKGADFMILNQVGRPDTGFEADTNQVVILGPDPHPHEIPLGPKEEIADKIYDFLVDNFLKENNPKHQMS